MMTANLFVTANVKQLRTGGSFRILMPSFRTSWGVGVLNAAIFNSFHNRVEFAAILEGLRNLGRGEVWTPPNTPLPPLVCHCPWSQNRDSTPCRDSLFFSSVQTDNGDHPTFYKLVMEPLSQGVSIQHMKLTSHPHLVSSWKCREPYPHSLIHMLGAVLK